MPQENMFWQSLQPVRSCYYTNSSKQFSEKKMNARFWQLEHVLPLYYHRSAYQFWKSRYKTLNKSKNEHITYHNMKFRILKTDFKYQTFSGILSDFSKKNKKIDQQRSRIQHNLAAPEDTVHYNLTKLQLKNHVAKAQSSSGSLPARVLL